MMKDSEDAPPDAPAAETAAAALRPVPARTHHGARALLTLIVFAGLGPPAGAFVYALGKEVAAVALGQTPAFAQAARDGLALAYPGAYYVGLVPAALTGALLSIAVWRHGRADWRLAALLALVGSGAGAWFAARGLGARLKPEDTPFLYGGFAALSLAAAMVCWWFASAFGIFREKNGQA